MDITSSYTMSDCARFKAERDALAQRMEEIASEIDRTLSGVEGIEDAPAMRWARGLREALGALHSPRTSYEDIEAARWVRDHGGLAAVRMSCGHADNRRVELCSAIGIDLDTGWSDAMERMRLRIMPDGMEWPRYEDGEPVHIGDEYISSIGLERKATEISFHQDGCKLGSAITYRYGERIRRTAPKVLDADGVEIRVGDTVYMLPGEWCDVFPCFGYHGGEELEVFSLRASHVEGGVGCRDMRRPKGTCYPQPSQLTHRAPVLAADGRPLREGETVYEVDTGDEFLVQQIYGGTTEPDFPDHTVRCSKSSDFMSHMFRPEQLTHERPDSWERLEEDAGKEACEYFAHMPCGCEASEMLDETVEKCNAAKARDLVRRAKALAVVER